MFVEGAEHGIFTFDLVRGGREKLSCWLLAQNIFDLTIGSCISVGCEQTRSHKDTWRRSGNMWGLTIGYSYIGSNNFTRLIPRTCPNCALVSYISFSASHEDHLKLLDVDGSLDHFDIFLQVGIQFLDVDVGPNFAVLSADFLGRCWTRHAGRGLQIAVQPMMGVYKLQYSTGNPSVSKFKAEFVASGFSGSRHNHVYRYLCATTRSLCSPGAAGVGRGWRLRRSGLCTTLQHK